MVEIEQPKAPDSAFGCLEGYAEEALWHFTATRSAAELMWQRTRSPYRVRWVIAGAQRFLTAMTLGQPDAFVRECQEAPKRADSALDAYWRSLTQLGNSVEQAYMLYAGPMLWLRANGIRAAWAPAAALAQRGNGGRPVRFPQLPPRDRFVLTALTGCNLVMAEMVALRLADVGEIEGPTAEWCPNPEVDAAAVRVPQAAAKDGQERVTFLTYDGGRMLQIYLGERRAAGHPLDFDAPLLADTGGHPITMDALAHLAKRMEGLMQVTRDLNVYFCIEQGKALRARHQVPAQQLQGE